MTVKRVIACRHSDTLEVSVMSDGVVIFEHTPGDNGFELDVKATTDLIEFLQEQLRYV